MSTHMPVFQSFLGFLQDFVLAKLANSSMRFKAEVFPRYSGFPSLCLVALATIRPEHSKTVNQ